MDVAPQFSSRLPYAGRRCNGRLSLAFAGGRVPGLINLINYILQIKLPVKCPLTRSLVFVLDDPD